VFTPEFEACAAIAAKRDSHCVIFIEPPRQRIPNRPNLPHDLPRLSRYQKQPKPITTMITIIGMTTITITGTITIIERIQTVIEIHPLNTKTFSG